MMHIEQRLNYKFLNPQLLEQALTHKSFANEIRGETQYNEKLEFLGDAVLSLVLGELLFDLFPDDSEGGLSKKRASVVNEEVLAELALEMGVHQVLRLGKGESAVGGALKPRLLASSFEAVVGAIYLDGGHEIIRNILRKEFGGIIESVCRNSDYERDYKSRLQELVQKEFKDTPKYELISQEGPPHERKFCVCLKVGEDIWSRGSGKSKKSAEQEAAKIALNERFKE